MLVDLRSRGNIPLKVCSDVVNYVSKFVNLIVEKSSETFETEPISFMKNDALLKDVVSNMVESFKNCKLLAFVDVSIFFPIAITGHLYPASVLETSPLNFPVIQFAVVVVLVGPLRAFDPKVLLDATAVITPLESAGVAGHGVGTPVHRVGIVGVRVKEQPFSFLVDECATRLTAAIQMIPRHLMNRHMLRHGRKTNDTCQHRVIPQRRPIGPRHKQFTGMQLESN